MGAAVVSAKVYGSMLANVAYVYSIAVGQATQIILGYMIGGRKLDKVSGRVWSTIRIALALRAADTADPHFLRSHLQHLHR